MCGLALAHVVGGLGLPRFPVGEHDVEIHILVVHGEHAAAGIGEQRHAVVVVAEGGLLALPGAARRMVEGGAVRPERIAPTRDHMPAEALRHGDRVEAVGGDGREIEARRPGPRHVRPRRADAQHERGRAEGGATAQKTAPRDRQFGQPLEIGGGVQPVVAPAGIVP